MPTDRLPDVERGLLPPFDLPLMLTFEMASQSVATASISVATASISVATASTSVATASRADATPRDVRIECDQILRLLPARRLVARGTFDQRVCVVKLFVGGDAERYFDRELNGVRALARTRVCAPALLATGTGKSGERALVYAYLASATPVSDHSVDEATALVEVFAHLHAAGCIHGDPHLDNFARSGGILYALDADGIRSAGATLTTSERERNLAQLLAQFPPRFDGHITIWLQAYRVAQPNAAELSAPRLDQALKNARAQRVRRYLKKTLRECSEFSVRKTSDRLVIARRVDMTDSLQVFADDPEAALRNAQVLKPGNSATVFRVTLGATTYVVKRYNLKSLWHRLRRSVKSRVRVAWTNGHLLAFLGIRTARPVMLIERRAGPLVGDAYIVMQDHGSLNLADAVETEGLRDSWLAAFEDLVVSLRNAQVRHGDFKATNFLVCGDALSLIDLDALGQGEISRDLPRFLKNWEHLPTVRGRFERSLKNLGFT